MHGDLASTIFQGVIGEKWSSMVYEKYCHDLKFTSTHTSWDTSDPLSLTDHNTCMIILQVETLKECGGVDVDCTPDLRINVTDIQTRYLEHLHVCFAGQYSRLDILAD